MISISDCTIEHGNGFLTLRPALSSPEGTIAFDRAVKELLAENPEFEIIQTHVSSQAGNGEWDFVIIKPPS